MNALCHLIRFLGCSVGLFMVVAGVAIAFGLVPYSGETPPWSARLISSAPPMFVGLVLLSPIDYFLRGAKFIALVCAYGITIVWALTFAASGLAAYAYGGKHWSIIPVTLVPLGVIVANAALLLLKRWQANRPTNNSFKPTSLRDTA